MRNRALCHPSGLYSHYDTPMRREIFEDTLQKIIPGRQKGIITPASMRPDVGPWYLFTAHPASSKAARRSNRVIATRRQPMCLTVQRSFIDFSSVSPGPKVRFGSIAPYLAKAKTPVCPLCSVSDHSAAEVVCLRSANSEHGGHVEPTAIQ
jgi:hypothetical protein